MSEKTSKTETVQLAELRRKFDLITAELTAGMLFDMESQSIMGGMRYVLMARTVRRDLGTIVVRLQYGCVVVTWWRA